MRRFQRWLRRKAGPPTLVFPVPVLGGNPAEAKYAAERDRMIESQFLFGGFTPTTYKHQVLVLPRDLLNILRLRPGGRQTPSDTPNPRPVTYDPQQAHAHLLGLLRNPVGKSYTS